MFFVVFSVYFICHVGPTHTLGSRKGHIPQLFEEEHAGYGGDHVHDEMVVHHAAGVHLQTLQIVWTELGSQLCTGQGYRGQKVRGNISVHHKWIFA